MKARILALCLLLTIGLTGCAAQRDAVKRFFTPQTNEQGEKEGESQADSWIALLPHPYDKWGLGVSALVAAEIARRKLKKKKPEVVAA